MTKKKLAWIVGVWLLLGVIVCVCVSLIAENDNAKEAAKEIKQSTAATAPAAEEKPARQYFKAGIDNGAIIRNPLMRNYNNSSRNDTPNGWLQVVSLAADEWESVTGEDLTAFFNAADFSGCFGLYFLERGNGFAYTGRGLRIILKGQNSSLGEFDADNLNDIKLKNEVRQFFYYADEKRIQYFNASDSDDEPLRDLLESDKPLLW